MNRQEFMLVIDGCDDFKNYSNYKLGLIWDFVNDLTPEEFSFIFKEIMSSAKFLPVPNDFMIGSAKVRYSKRERAFKGQNNLSFRNYDGYDGPNGKGLRKLHLVKDKEE